MEPKYCWVEHVEHAACDDCNRCAHDGRKAPIFTDWPNHGDRGVQYACHAYRELLEEHGMAQSMSRAGNGYDNAIMESLWSTPKKELVRDQRFRTHDEARAAIFEWFEV